MSRSIDDALAALRSSPQDLRRIAAKSRGEFSSEHTLRLLLVANGDDDAETQARLEQARLQLGAQGHVSPAGYHDSG